MTIKIANNALDDCTSIEQVVELMNNEFATDASPELIAAAYAIDSIDSEYNGTTIKDILECHMDFLIDAGAKFNFKKAIDIALNEVAE